MQRTTTLHHAKDHRIDDAGGYFTGTDVEAALQELGADPGREILTANRTYYVRTDGSDSNDGLTDSSGGAFLTIGKAILTTQGIDLAGYTVTIQVGAGTFAESLDIRNILGKVLIRGTLTELETVTGATVAQGTGGTQSTVTKTNAFSGDSYASLLCYFVTDDAYRLIDSHTVSVLTLVGLAPSATTQDIIIYDWGTSASDINIYGMSGVDTRYMKFTADDSNWQVGSTDVVYSECHFQAMTVRTGADVSIYNSIWVSASTTCINSYQHGSTVLSRCKIYTSASPGYGINCFRMGFINIRNGTILTAITTYALYCQDNSSAAFTNFSGDYCRIRNSGTGVYAVNGGTVTGTGNVQYSGNVTNENASAATYSYID